MSNCAYICADTETTGLYPVLTDTVKGPRGPHAIIQLGAVAYDKELNELDRFDSYVYPFEGAEVDEFALLATGIDMVRVWSAPSERIIAKRFEVWTHKQGRKPKFMGFNTKFDLGFFTEMQKRTGTAFNYDYSPAWCLLMDAKKYLKHLPSRKLVDLCAYFQIPHSNAHNAMADCLATREVALKMRAL